MTDDRAAVRGRLSIFEAFLRVLADPHEFLDLVLRAEDAESVLVALGERFGFDAVQSQAVLDLQFRRATVLDRDRLAAEVHRLRQELDGPAPSPD